MVTCMSEVVSAPGVSVSSRPNLLERILAEEATLERQVKEALFLTFNVDLGFFESRLLGPCRAAGAAVTVVADSSIFRPDVRAVRAAGSSYVVGLASMNGAFHPKLTVLVGDQRALVAIGSGNVTMQGWHQNEELCTIITADRGSGCPAVVRELTQWLRELGSTVMLSPLAVDAIERTASALQNLADASPAVETGHVLASSLITPIIDQLPQSPASHLNLYAPFHDERGAAFKALIERFRPSTISLAVQPGSTVISPSTLDKIAKDRGVRLIFQDASATTSTYRHGKLLEALQPDGRRWALTGSANLSAAALLLTPRQNGNCEIGVLTDIPQSLYPSTGASLLASEMEDVSLRVTSATLSTPAASAVVTLSQATIHENVLTVVLTRAAAVELTVQASRFEDPPEKYMTVGTIAAGLSSARFEVDLPATSRIRLRAADAAGSVWGYDFPLIDPVGATRRVQARGHGNPYAHFDPVDLFNDPRLAEQWHDALNKVLHAQIRTRLPRASAGSTSERAGSASVSPAEGWMTLDSPDAWAKYSEDAETRLGTSMYEFALGGLPQFGASSARSVVSRTPRWVDRVDGTDEEFDDENTVEDVVAELELAGKVFDVRPDPRQRTESEKRRYRVWLARLTEDLPELEAIDRSSRAGLVLIGTQIDVWNNQAGSAEWFETLAAAVGSLSIEPIPANLRPQMAALATVGLYRMSEGLSRNSSSAHESIYARTRNTLRGLLASTEADQLSANIESLNVGRSFKVGFDIVEQFGSSLVANDSLQDLVDRIERALPDWNISALGGHSFTVEGTFSNPAQVAAQVIGLASDLPTVAVRALGSRERWSTMARHRDHLAVVELGKSGRLNYRAYQLSSGVSAVRIVEDEGLSSRVRLDSPPWIRASPEVLEVFREARVSLHGELES